MDRGHTPLCTPVVRALARIPRKGEVILFGHGTTERLRPAPQPMTPPESRLSPGISRADGDCAHAETLLPTAALTPPERTTQALLSACYDSSR
jgi:hypothetical protein